jgi:hypothetical protein
MVFTKLIVAALAVAGTAVGKSLHQIQAPTHSFLLTSSYPVLDQDILSILDCANQDFQMQPNPRAKALPLFKTAEMLLPSATV